MEYKTSGTHFSPNGSYILLVVKDVEYLYHLSIPWVVASATTHLDDRPINKVIKQILRRIGS